MTRLDILVPLSGADDDDALLAYSKAVAVHLGSDLTALLVQADPMESLAMAGDPSLIMFSPTVVDGLKAGLKDVAAASAARTAALGDIKFESFIGPAAAVLPNRSSVIDFAIVSCACARNQGLMTGVCELLLMEARVPVLISRGEPEALRSAALVAWDGGPESGRALRRALPLLAKAERVVIAQVNKPLKERAARFNEPERAVAFLKRHGIAAEATLLPDSDHEAQALLSYANVLDAGLLVAGAYGHSRLQEFIFGGSTKVFLNAKTSPALFLVH